MQLGTVTRDNDRILFCRGPLYSLAVGVNVRLAMDWYGHLLARFESVTVYEWIHRIRKGYAKSQARNTIIRSLIIASRDETKAQKYLARGILK